MEEEERLLGIRVCAGRPVAQGVDLDRERGVVFRGWDWNEGWLESCSSEDVLEGRHFALSVASVGGGRGHTYTARAAPCEGDYARSIYGTELRDREYCRRELAWPAVVSYLASRHDYAGLAWVRHGKLDKTRSGSYGNGCKHAPKFAINA